MCIRDRSSSKIAAETALASPMSEMTQPCRAVFAENGLDTAAICGVYSIDLKQDEAGLLAACEKNNWPVHFYTAQQLRGVAGDFTPSDFVRSVTGVDNVCERAALLDAEKLIVQKTARDGVTVAVAAEHWEVRFG